MASSPRSSHSGLSPRPPSSRNPSSEPPSERAKPGLISLYEAVSGTLNTKGRRTHPPNAPKTSLHGFTVERARRGPEDQLFTLRGAPQRYAELDTYNAHEALPHGALPDSDMLKAIHRYTVHYYQALYNKGHGVAYGGKLGDSESMDETALLTFGVLLEEAGREVLGGTGDLVFVEGDEEMGKEGDGEGDGDEQPKPVEAKIPVPRVRRVRTKKSAKEAAGEATDGYETSATTTAGEARASKRRKTGGKAGGKS